MRITTFRNPVLSLAQSALHETLLAHAARGVEGVPVSAQELSAADPRMQLFVALTEAHGYGAEPPAEPGAAPVPEGRVDTCVRMYAEMARIALEEGPTAARKFYEDNIQFQGCDPFWAETVARFLAFLKSGKTIPYVQLALDEGVLPLGGSPVKVAVVGDWGTGTEAAARVLREIAAHRPDVVIHLGDIYYAGTPGEVSRNFQKLFEPYPELQGKVYTLSGNHDMYSGGAGYYPLIETLGQPASYFCLRNDDWQIVTMDTGLHDRDPFTITVNITRLKESEAEWIVDKVRNSGGRGTILLSHHQLYSRNAPVGETIHPFRTKAWGVNPHLYEQLREILDDVTVWLWGHEHNTVIFKPEPGLPLGRCVGSGAIPMPTEPDPYSDYTRRPLKAPGGLRVPVMDLTHRLSSAPNAFGETLYYHGYALLSLDKGTATITYYQVPPVDAQPVDPPSPVVFTETLAPRGGAPA